MEAELSILGGLATYPKSTLLFLVALLNLGWVSYIVFVKKHFKENIYKAYFLYAFFAIIWVISNAYFQSQFLVLTGKQAAKFMALLANVAASCSIIGFYYISCYVKRPKISLFSWTLMIFLAGETFLLNLIPGLTVKEVLIFRNGTFQLIQGNWTGPFFLIGSIVIIMSFINFVMAIRRNKAKIENIRVFYILFGMTLLYSSIILFLIIFPYYFQNYRYAWIPPFMSIADVLIVGYAIVTQRFLDIRLFISRFFKVIIAFFIACFIGLPVSMKLSEIFNDIDDIYWIFIGTAFIIFFFTKVLALFNSRAFYGYFGGTDAEHIGYITSDLRKKSKVYTSIKSCESDLQSMFIKKMKGVLPQIIIIKDSFKKKYPRLTNYFKKHRGLLVTEELRFVESNRSRVIPLLRELEFLGGVCIPLFHPSKGLVALFTLGRKKYSHFYSKEEIAALENLASYLNVTVLNILYNHELRTEVSKKTKQLKKKIDQINELLRQQSDFIAVTAHELRTPLSIATFQLADATASKKISGELMDDLKIVDSSLDNLKRLTEKLFTVQQYDLNKVELHLEKVNMRKFLKGLCKDFSSITKDKKLHCSEFIDLDEKTYAKIDQAQVRQVLHNLLSNAIKFTPLNGLITVEATSEKGYIIIKVSDNGEGIPDHLKNAIFEKFRTKKTGAGIGLGLYLCKKIMELHKGKIWVENSLLGGAAFCMSFKKLTR